MHTAALLERIERFYDAVPRRVADAESHDGLTLFVRRGVGFAYYARPTLGASPGAVAVRRVLRRQRELGVPAEFEWIEEITPGLAAAATEAGLAVRRCPLMVLETHTAPAPPDGLRFLHPDADDAPALAADIHAVASVGFGAPGTQAGEAGAPERDAARVVAPLDDATLNGLRSGAIARAAIIEGTGAVCAGNYQRAGDVVEIVGVATLPAARRRGLGGAITAALAARALDAGATTVFLSAGDAEVARVYARLGFVQIATACLAEPSS